MESPPGSVDQTASRVQPDSRRAGDDRRFTVPLVVAVTGHRDLVLAEVPAIRARVREFLRELCAAYPQRSVAVLSALAEGADRLVAGEALELGLPLTVVLPMARGLYAEDFITEASRADFDRYCDAAEDVFELPITTGNTVDSIRDDRKNRSRQYAQAGVFLCAHCHVLLALWDGKESDQLGGTSQVVRFHHHDDMPGYTPRTAASRLVLTDDESDLVYHIVCSRDRADGAPAPGLTPLEAFWYTTDEAAPRVAAMPSRHRQVFDRAAEFSRDVDAHQATIRAAQYPLLTEPQAVALPHGLQHINDVYCSADGMASHYQKRMQSVLRATHVCALFTGLVYISYSDFSGDRRLLLLLLTLMLLALGVTVLAARRAWHRKYLDYRALAEGLRVQFYWAAAGVTSGNVSKFAHDNFLQMQDTDLGWIRNVMRVAGTQCDAAPNAESSGVRFVLDEWIGDENSGQLGYYRRKIGERLVRQRATQRVARLGLLATFISLAALLLVGSGLPDAVQNPVTYLMGCTLLLVGVRQSYAKSTAESELIKQYEFMHRIFRNARRRLDDAESDAERRRILKSLGDAALEEHAQWILMHRERAIDQRDALRLG
jgi:hypothetical protein